MSNRNNDKLKKFIESKDYIPQNPELITKFLNDNKITVEDFGENNIKLPDPILSWNDLKFPIYIYDSLNYLKYQNPFPIQSMAIPSILFGYDLVCIAESGSGKTASFVIPSLIHIMAQPLVKVNEGPIVLVISPTIDLATQTYKYFEQFGKNVNLKPCLIVGKQPAQMQLNIYSQGVDVMVATPGRLKDFVQNKGLDLSRVTLLILDEADILLTMGFSEQIQFIISQIPSKNRQTILTSATWPSNVKTTAKQICKDNPVLIKVGQYQHSINYKIKQTILVVNNKEQKYSLFINKLRELKKTYDKFLVFANQKATCEWLSYKINGELDFQRYSKYIHGEFNSYFRQREIEKFQLGETKILITTDMCSRGIDFKNLYMVINYDVPSYIEDYIHRIGRVGRGNNNGDSISFFSIDTDFPIQKPLMKFLQQSNQLNFNKDFLDYVQSNKSSDMTNVQKDFQLNRRPQQINSDNQIEQGYRAGYFNKNYNQNQQPTNQHNFYNNNQNFGRNYNNNNNQNFGRNYNNNNNQNFGRNYNNNNNQNFGRNYTNNSFNNNVNNDRQFNDNRNNNYQNDQINNNYQSDQINNNYQNNPERQRKNYQDGINQNQQLDNNQRIPNKEVEEVKQQEPEQQQEQQQQQRRRRGQNQQTNNDKQNDDNDNNRMCNRNIDQPTTETQENQNSNDYNNKVFRGSRNNMNRYQGNQDDGNQQQGTFQRYDYEGGRGRGRGRGIGRGRGRGRGRGGYNDYNNFNRNNQNRNEQEDEEGNDSKFNRNKNDGQNRNFRYQNDYNSRNGPRRNNNNRDEENEQQQSYRARNQDNEGKDRDIQNNNQEKQQQTSGRHRRNEPANKEEEEQLKNNSNQDQKNIQQQPQQNGEQEKKNEGEVKKNEVEVKKNEGEVKKNEGEQKKNEGEVKKNEGEQKKNEGEVKKNEGEVKKNEGEVKKNEGEVKNNVNSSQNDDKPVESRTQKRDRREKKSEQEGENVIDNSVQQDMDNFFLNESNKK